MPFMPEELPFSATSFRIWAACEHSFWCPACHSEMKHASEQNAVPHRQTKCVLGNSFWHFSFA
eukprot:CAMPEP_0168482054 /NCGR_PEP_ID=MMETSP0228-20121227/64835_1 /TAXON_ID=133427 /ORGANISM="Protoceratium reticulatum, Strain CCCM 535 (=CCMP 1889)" /LENGTH=62 /DNA_ID=CAMNT_0008498453 /DNA_START=25 /DNA_END=209 /DNA_ORIENTATION=+